MTKRGAFAGLSVVARRPCDRGSSRGKRPGSALACQMRFMNSGSAFFFASAGDAARREARASTRKRGFREWGRPRRPRRPRSCLATRPARPRAPARASIPGGHRAQQIPIRTRSTARARAARPRPSRGDATRTSTGCVRVHAAGATRPATASGRRRGVTRGGRETRERLARQRSCDIFTVGKLSDSQRG